VRRDAERFEEAHLFRVPAVEVDSSAVQLQDLCDEEAELAIAENRDGSAAGDSHLVKDLTGGGDWFGENGVEEGNSRRNFVEVLLGKGEKFSEGSGMADNAKDRPVRAMTPQASCTEIAFSTRKIDFPDDFLSEPARVIAGDDFADELVAWCSGESVISALEVEVSRANAGVEQANEGITSGASGWRDVFDGNNSAFEVDRDHECFPR
jgi:hypothetical protein